MEKDWQAEWRKEAEQRRNEERKKLLSLSDFEAEQLPIPDQYQRMRYQREIEAAQELENIRRKIIQPNEKENTPDKIHWKVKSKNVIYWRKDWD